MSRLPVIPVHYRSIRICGHIFKMLKILFYHGTGILYKAVDVGEPQANETLESALISDVTLSATYVNAIHTLYQT